ncbi:hypothetical protein LTR72_007533 [Exophiala xenobiotica]|nr:hypothetical protein LTR72_007533 [Exophiala xenobiotica]KAK5292819.1 hypothetical protein LTR14_005168 [Exophiala xenobiotica]KAK5444535.1 hypothetical protein LTR18_004239 [Exophiala xenobiotica]KAK5484421.1 hypothetical protein LTR55_005917 [Exophiala xenobiotica]
MQVAWRQTQTFLIGRFWVSKRGRGCDMANISVFLSCPRPINKAQQDFIDKLSHWLKTCDMMPRTPGVTDHSDRPYLEAIRSLMAESNGLLCVAFRQTHIDKGEGTVRFGRKLLCETKPINDVWLTSPWAHIEPAMAYQVGLPILILREAGVVDDGVLGKGILGLYMPQFDLADLGEEHYLSSPEWAEISKRWEGHVRTVVDNKGRPPKLY